MAQLLEQEVAELHREFGDGLLRYATSLAGDQDAACDAVQEAFLRYFVERRYGRTIGNPRAWLYLVLRNYLLDRLKAFPANRQADPHLLESLPSPQGTPEEDFQHSEAAHEIIATLSARELDCLRLRAEGLSYNEIAAALEIQPGTVGALLNRVHHKLEQSASVPPRKSFQELANALRCLVRGALAYSST